jgi:hypothetical protein
MKYTIQLKRNGEKVLMFNDTAVGKPTEAEAYMWDVIQTLTKTLKLIGTLQTLDMDTDGDGDEDNQETR